MALILDNTYQIRKEVYVNHRLNPLNVHEFKLVDQGRRALVISNAPPAYDSQLNREIDNPSVEELDLGTGYSVFHWEALDHFSPWASYVKAPESNTDLWEWL